MEINFSKEDKAPASAAKRGPGRPPGSANKAPSKSATAAKADVDQALATMESLYTATTIGLTMFGLVETAEDWIAKAEELQKTNREALTAAPRLAASIAKAGQVGGAGMFFGAHAIALFGLVNSARAEMRKNNPAPDNVTQFPDASTFPETPFPA